VLLIVISVFPGTVIWFADLLGVVSPANLVFLLIIFLLVIQLFSTTVKLSKMDDQIASLTQRLAIAEVDFDNKLKDKDSVDLDSPQQEQ
jgi:hypothetical protein